jgi:hypothetical protein
VVADDIASFGTVDNVFSWWEQLMKFSTGFGYFTNPANVLVVSERLMLLISCEKI